MRFHNRWRLSFNLCSNCSIVTPVGPGRSTVPLHLQPRIPHQVLGDVLRLALQLRLTHAIPSLSVDHIRSPGRPRPFAPQPTAIRRRITATTGESASAPRVGTQPLTDSAAWGSPSRVPAPTRYPWVRTPRYRDAPSHVPDESLDQAHAACMPDTTWAVSGYLPDSSRSKDPPPVLMSSH